MTSTIEQEATKNRLKKSIDECNIVEYSITNEILGRDTPYPCYTGRRTYHITLVMIDNPQITRIKVPENIIPRLEKMIKKVCPDKDIPRVLGLIERAIETTHEARV